MVKKEEKNILKYLVLFILVVSLVTILKSNLTVTNLTGFQIASENGFNFQGKKLSEFAIQAGGWNSYDKNPRQLGDVNGDRKADIVGFSCCGVSVAFAKADGSGFETPNDLLSNLFAERATAGSWVSFNKFPRLLGDVNGDGKSDIVGFATDGVYVALSTGNGFDYKGKWMNNVFGTNSNAGGWESFNKFPRLLGDVDGDGKADIVGFATDGVYVALSTGNGFDYKGKWMNNVFGTNSNAGGWESFNKFPRLLGDINGDGKADIVGFATDGVYVALSTGNGFIYQGKKLSGVFGLNAGGWSSYNVYPRLLGDVNGDGKADVIGMGENGVWVSLSTGNGFEQSILALSQFAIKSGGWSSYDKYPRQLRDVNGDGKADIVGFASDGVYVALSTGNFVSLSSSRKNIVYEHATGDTLGGPGWNEHLPKLTSDGIWDYAVYSHLAANNYGERFGKIFKQKRGTDQWIDTGRTVSYIHQPLGITFDNDGRLHMTFNCLSENGVAKSCMVGGFHSQGLNPGRFYQAIFPDKNPDGSVNLDSSATAVNYNEYTQPSFGYLGQGYDFVHDITYLSTSSEDFNRKIFKGGPNTNMVDVEPGNRFHRPVFATSSDGVVYYFDHVLIKDWQNTLGKAGAVNRVLVYTIEGNNLRKVWEDSLAFVDGVTSWMWADDATGGEDGTMWFLVHKKEPAKSDCTYLVKIKGTNVIYTKPAGCVAAYTQLQVARNGNLYMVGINGKSLNVYKSIDDGNSWTKTIYIPPNLLPETDHLRAVQLMKKWSAPKGYDPNILYGIYSGTKMVNGQEYTYYLGTFRIDVSN